MNNEIIDKVNKWMDDGCCYDAGCALYSIYGKNKVLSRLFPGREARYAGKLKYELCKSVGLIDVFHETTQLIDVPKEDEKQLMNLPDEVSRVTTELSKLTADRSKLHARMASMEGNDATSINIRKELSDEIERLSICIENLYTAKEAWYNENIIPDIAALFPDKPVMSNDQKTDEIILPDAVEKLKEYKRNLQTSLSKDRNCLEFQSDTKKDAPSPMPAGPNRIKIEKRKAKKEKIIEAIDLKLAESAD
ncbi:MAG: hypothetical protein NTZ33_06225 [Bacteroidetes bacterium]|nr:hypothetical protein [Bacteroidota bacterium]